MTKQMQGTYQGTLGHPEIQSLVDGCRLMLSPQHLRMRVPLRFAVGLLRFGTRTDT